MRALTAIALTASIVLSTLAGCASTREATVPPATHEALVVSLVRHGEKGDAARGRAQFEGKGCAACHGLHGEGRGVGMGPGIRETTTGELKERIVQMMWNHATEMGKRMANKQLEWPRFTAEELADLLTFLTEGWSESSGGEPGR